MNIRINNNLLKVKVLNDDNLGTNSIARYIRNHPSVSLPMFTVALYLISYSNKWGSFSYFGIEPTYINFDFTQTLLSLDYKSILYLIIISGLFYFAFSIVSKLADDYRGKVNNNYKKRFHEKGLPNPLYTLIGFRNLNVFNHYAIPVSIALFIGLIAVASNFFLSETNSPNIFACLMLIIILYVCFYTIISRFYMGSILVIVFCLSLISYNYGYVNVATQTYFDKTSNSDHVIVDYFGDKYIIMETEEFENCVLTSKTNGKKNCSFEVRSIYEREMTISNKIFEKD